MPFIQPEGRLAGCVTARIGEVLKALLVTVGAWCVILGCLRVKSLTI